MSKTKKKQGEILTNNINNEVRKEAEAFTLSNISFLEKLTQIKLLVLFSSIIILMLSWIYKGFIWGKYAYMFRDIGSDSYNLIYPQFYHHASYLEKFGSMPKW